MGPSFQVFVLQQFDPGMEYRPDWGLKQQIQQANNGANSLGHNQAAAGRILRGAKVQGPPGGPPGGPQGQIQGWLPDGYKQIFR